MSRIFRNVLFWVLIFFVIIGVIGVFSGQNEQQEQFNVQEFMNELNAGNIEEMTMQPANSIMRYTGTLADGQQFVAQIPDNTDIISAITEQANEQSVLFVEEEEQPSAWVTFLTTMIPFLIIALFFLFIIIQYTCSGSGVSILN